MQLISELMYNFVAQLLSDTVGDNGKKYFPFVFLFHVCFNWQHGRDGSISIYFYKSYHCNFCFAAVVFIGVTILGFVNHGIKFFTFFIFLVCLLYAPFVNSN